MTLIVEDGSGLTNAESYLSVAEADAYNDLFCNGTWTSATTDQKEVALREATRYVDARFHGRWKGRRSHQLQALDWPRFNVVDADSFWIESDSIPKKLKDAVAQFALIAVAGEDLLPDLDKPGNIKKERLKAGSVEREIEYVGGRSQTKQYRLADFLLKDYVGPTGVMERA